MYSIISWLYLHYRWSATHTHWQIKLKKHHANINTDTSWSGIPSSYSPATQCEQKWSTNSDVAFVQESSVISFTLHWISSFLISRFFFDTWRYNSSSRWILVPFFLGKRCMCARNQLALRMYPHVNSSDDHLYYISRYLFVCLVTLCIREFPAH